MHKLPVAQVNAGVVAQVAIAHGVEAHDIAALQVADAFDLGTVLIACVCAERESDTPTCL